MTDTAVQWALRTRRARARTDAGASFIEYAGVGLTIGAITAGILATGFDATSSRIIAQIEDKICEAFSLVGGGDDCNSVQALEDEAYEPDKCLVSQNSGVAGVNASAFVFDISTEVSFVVQEESDGTVKVTVIDTKGGGVSTGVGADVDLGRSAEAGAGIDVGAGLTLENGSTWLLDSPEEAQALMDDIAQYAMAEEMAGGMGPVTDWVTDQVAPDVPDPDITRTGLGAEVGVEGSLGAKFGSDKKKDPDTGETGRDYSIDPKAGIQGAVGLDTVIAEERNHTTGETTTIYEANTYAEIEGNAVVAKTTAGYDRTGTIKITEDADGNITKLELIQVEDDGVGSTAPVVTTTEITVDGPEEAAMVEEWMGTFSDDNVLPLTWDAMDPTELGDDPTPFDEWVFENGRTTRAEYTGTDNVQSAGAEIRAGLKLGLGVTGGSTSLDVENAEFLGAPGADGTREYVPFEACGSSEFRGRAAPDKVDTKTEPKDGTSIDGEDKEGRSVD